MGALSGLNFISCGIYKFLRSTCLPAQKIVVVQLLECSVSPYQP
jgi:hypothetical protein